MAVDTATENVDVNESEEHIEEDSDPAREALSASNIMYENSTFSESRDDDLASYLVCQCQTPSGNKATCLITDNHDGTYTVDINASEPGIHTVDVELDGNKIPGSPFLVRIVQAADKKKVLLYGKGLNSGLLEDFESLFHVDTKGAGPGDLKVRINGPKDGFNVVMSREHPDDRQVNINYHPTVSGIYTINVYWGGEHVVGSPREVFIAPESDHLITWHDDPQSIREEENLTHRY